MGSSSHQKNKMCSRKPLGIQLFECVRGSPISFRSCQALVLLLTFLSYASYHATRKTTSIVKSVLDPKKNLAIGGQYLSVSEAGVLSTLFDVGGVVGGILAGHISDHLDARALTAASFTFSAIPALFFYRIYGNVSLAWNIALMFVTGMLVNGPYALITTAVSADLGTHSSLNGNSRALATVTAIIDGTGSIGAAVGPLLTGYISARSWSAVFTMLMASALVAGLLLSRLVVAEVAAKMESRRTPAPAASDLPVSSMEEP